MCIYFSSLAAFSIQWIFDEAFRLAGRLEEPHAEPFIFIESLG